jgi:hypothetical protein
MPLPASSKVVNLPSPGFTEILPTLLHAPCSRVPHQLAMHYSLSLVGTTVIFYHAPRRVLGNDKRLAVELPLLP